MSKCVEFTYLSWGSDVISRSRRKSVAAPVVTDGCCRPTVKVFQFMDLHDTEAGDF